MIPRFRPLIDWLLATSPTPSPGQQLAALSAHSRIVAASNDRERARLVAKQMRDAMPGRDWRVAL